MAVERGAYGRAPFIGPMTSAQEDYIRRECLRPDGFVEVHPLPDLPGVIDLIEVNGVWMTPEDARRA